MIKSCFSLIFFLSLSLIINGSCDQRPKKSKKSSKSSTDSVKTGLVKALFDNGKVRAEIKYKDGKKHGVAKEYFKEGGLFQEISYENGVKNGTAKRYHKNGKPYQSTDYKMGKMHGKQIKYRENGQLASEANYMQDEPCSGLVEYTLEGSKKKKYPSIIIKPIDNLLSHNKYILRIEMSDKAKAVEYYTGNLTKEGCFGESAQKIWGKIVNGSIDVEYNVPPGMFIMERINIIARVKTPQGKYYVTQRAYNVAAENR
jgi:hypothetical protein